MSAGLRPGLPPQAYQLGSLTGVIRPSAQSLAVGLLPVLGLVLLVAAGAAAIFAGTQSEDPLLSLGKYIGLLAVFPFWVLLNLLSKLYKDQRGMLLTLTEGFIILVPDWDRKKARVYRWSDVLQVADGDGTNLAASGAAPSGNTPPEASSKALPAVKLPLSHGVEQFSIRTADSHIWTFGSDLDNFGALRRLFQEKANAQ